MMIKNILEDVDMAKISTGNPIIEQINPQELYFTNQQMEGFEWKHNSFDESSYKDYIDNLESVENLLSKGYSLQDIQGHGPDYANVVESNFGDNMIQVYRSQDGKFLFSGNDGRHRILMAQQQGLDKFTVKVIGEYSNPLLSQSIDLLSSAGQVQSSFSSSDSTVIWLNSVINKLLQTYSDQSYSCRQKSAYLDQISSLVQYHFGNQETGRDIINLLYRSQGILLEASKILDYSSQQLRVYQSRINS